MYILNEYMLNKYAVDINIDRLYGDIEIDIDIGKDIGI